MKQAKKIFFTDPQVAERIAALVHQQSTALNQSLRDVQRECPATEFELYREAVGTVMGYMFTRILDPLWSANPGLVPESMKDEYDKDKPET